MTGILRSIAISAADTACAAASLTAASTTGLAFQDGSRWLSFEPQQVAVVMAEPEELPAGAAISLNIKVEDVPATLDTLRAVSGVRVVQAPTVGAHEERAAVEIAGGVVLSLYRSIA